MGFKMSGWSPFTNKIDPPKKNVNKKNLSAPKEQTREILPSLVTPTHASKSGKLVNTFSSPIPFIPKVVNKKIRRKKINEEDVGKPKSSAFPKTSPFKEDESNPEYRDNNNLFTDYNESIDLNKDGKIQEEEVDAYREQMRAKSSKYKGNLGPQEKPYSSDQSTYGQLWDRGASEIKDMSDKEFNKYINTGTDLAQYTGVSPDVYRKRLDRWKGDESLRIKMMREETRYARDSTLARNVFGSVDPKNPLNRKKEIEYRQRQAELDNWNEKYGTRASFYYGTTPSYSKDGPAKHDIMVEGSPANRRVQWEHENIRKPEWDKQDKKHGRGKYYAEAKEKRKKDLKKATRWWKYV